MKRLLSAVNYSKGGPCHQVQRCGSLMLDFDKKINCDKKKNRISQALFLKSNLD